MTIDYEALLGVCGEPEPVFICHHHDDCPTCEAYWFRHMVEWLVKHASKTGDTLGCEHLVHFNRHVVDLLTSKGSHFLGEGPTLLEALAAAVLKVGKEGG